MFTYAKNICQLIFRKSDHKLPGTVPSAKHFLRELRAFFEDYKKLEHKTVEVEEFQNAEVARQIIEKSIEDYDRLIKPLISF